MKISDVLIYRNSIKLNITESSSGIKYFRTINIDWNVYLPSINKNLQRDFVWTLKQKQELIWSILIGRHIPHCAVVNIIDPKDPSKEIWQIIDGKQRLSTIFDFIDNKFQILDDDGILYNFNDLPSDLKQIIEQYRVRYYIATDIDKPITDQDKINWFKFINFAGTEQDEKHLKSLE